MPRSLLRLLALPFFTALGIELGGPLVGAVPSLLLTGRPLKTALELARDLRFWAIAMAIGGSFTVLEALETGLVHRQIHSVARQAVTITGAFIGAQLGYWLIARLAEPR
jgi:hypothetical protein